MTAFAPGRARLTFGYGSTMGRLDPIDRGGANGWYRRISPVAAHSGDRLLSEPTADTQPCRREPLFMPQSCPS
jgi:hypothetical protein